MKTKKLVVLGGGESGVGAAILAKEKGMEVFLSDMGKISPRYATMLDEAGIEWEDGQHTEAKILDTVLHWAVEAMDGMPRAVIILFVYLLVLAMNFFISSGSAKAFLLMPLIVPLAQIFDISSQLSVMAFAFGDGFSNVMYPTNPVLLISLGMAGISYVKWFKWTFKIQSTILVATSPLLLFGLAIGYN